MGVRTAGLLVAVSNDGPECVIAIGLLSLMSVVTGPGRAALEHMRKVESILNLRMTRS